MSDWFDRMLVEDGRKVLELVYNQRRTMASRENSGQYDPQSGIGGVASAGYSPTPAPGNGEQVGFATGATRSNSDDKIDYEGYISPVVLRLFGEYMHEHRIQRDGKVRASDNWQQGIPIYRYVKSLIRHTQEFWLMWRGEVAINPDNGKPFTLKQVLCAILFNTMGILFEMGKQNMSWLLDRTYMVPADRVNFETADKPKQPTVKTETVPTPFAAMCETSEPAPNNPVSSAYCADESSLLTGACCGQPATCKYPCSEGKQKQRIYDGTWPGGAGSFTFVPENARDAYRITITRQS